MSFILDALRKSENTKHRGDVPTIHSSQELEVTPGARRRKGPLVLVLLPAFLVLVWFGSRQFTGPGLDTAAPKQAAEVQESSEPAVRQSRPPAESAAGDNETAPPRERPAPAVNAPALARVADDPPETSGPRTPVEEFEVVSSGQPDEAAQTDMSLRTFRLDGQPEATTPSPGGESRDTGPDTYEPPRPSDISYWALPETVRRELPEFHISVMVYAERPEDRFLLLNGNRLAEGDEYQPGLVLEEIRRDGAIFSYRLYRFLVTQ